MGTNQGLGRVNGAVGIAEKFVNLAGQNLRVVRIEKTGNCWRSNL